MTKSWEKGESPIIDYVRREAKRTGKSIDEILEAMIAEAKRARDGAHRVEIQKAQKFLKIRNPRKRRSK